MRTSTISLSILLILYFIVLVSWTIYRYTTQLPEYVDELIAKPIIWTIPVFLVMLWKKIKLSTLGFSTPSFRVILISVVTGILLSILQIVPNLLKGATQQIDFENQFLSLLMLPYLGTAISEEILFRGFFLQQLKQKFSSPISIILSSFLFTIIHLPILFFITQLSGLNLIVGLYVIFVSGVVFGVLFLRFKTIWSPLIAHFILDVLLTVL